MAEEETRAAPDVSNEPAGQPISPPAPPPSQETAPRTDEVAPALEPAPPPPQPDSQNAPAAEAASPASPSETEKPLTPAADLPEILDGIKELLRAFDEKFRRDQSRDKTIDRLHEEVQQYKQDLLYKIFKQVVMDLIALHDGMSRVAEVNRGKLASGEEVPAAGLLNSFDVFRRELEDILARRGVEAFELEEERFDPRRQRPQRVVPCEDESRNGMIAQRVGKGFKYEEKIIRPELVNVYKAAKRDPSAEQKKEA